MGWSELTDTTVTQVTEKSSGHTHRCQHSYSLDEKRDSEQRKRQHQPVTLSRHLEDVTMVDVWSTFTDWSLESRPVLPRGVFPYVLCHPLSTNVLPET